MDTSLQYVRMCKGASEIQEQWKFVMGEYFSTIPQETFHEQQISANGEPDTKGFSIVDQWWLDETFTKKHLESRTFPEPWAWLPRQDQLQEMLSDEHRTIHKDTYAYKVGNYPNGFIARVLIAHFHKFLGEEYEYTDHIGFDSMEQLWLAYVMDHVYAKRWDGSEWIPSIGGT